MAQITLTIPDDKINDILDAFAANYGYDAGSGLTKSQFAKSKLIDFIIDNVKSYKIRTNSATVIQTADSDSKNLNIT